jgi:uncharacterized protein (TIGR02594 family)
VSKTTKWLRATVDNKPWWAIILAAFLASLGSEAMKRVPDLISWVRSSFPIEPTVYVFLKEKCAGPPIDGARVSVMDTSSGNLLVIQDANATSVTTKGGFASAKIRVMPRPGYALVLSYTQGGKEFHNTLPIELRGDVQHQLEFDPQKWTLAGVLQERAPSSQGTSIIEGESELPPWMKYAYGERGVHEIKGSEHNSRILAYFRSTRAATVPEDDETPWASAFIHWVFDQVGIAGTQSLLTRSWLTWGRPSKLKPGCVAVFWRTRRRVRPRTLASLWVNARMATWSYWAAIKATK